MLPVLRRPELQDAASRCAGGERRPIHELPLATALHAQPRQAHDRALEHPEWIDDPRFASAALRVKNRDNINRLIATAFAKRDAADWARRIEAANLAFGPVLNYREALDDPQVRHRGQVRTLEHPASGAIGVVGPPWNFDGVETPMSPPPLLGEHTDAVLRDWLAWDEIRIARFHAEHEA